MSNSYDLLRQFFYEQSVDGKKYRIYTVNSIALLNITSKEALSDVKKIIDILKQEGNINALLSLLSDKNWRTQIIGVIGSFAVEVNEQVISKMWNLFDQGNWISPQITVSLFFQDKDFIEKAILRINSFFEIQNKTAKEQCKISKTEKIFMSKNGLISLLVLCRQVSLLEDWTTERLMSLEFKKITVNSDIEQINNLCLNWMMHMSKCST